MNYFLIIEVALPKRVFRTYALAVVGLGVMLANSLPGAEAVRLHPYPQKVRTFYSLNSPEVPAALRLNPVPLPLGSFTATVRAGDGAIWLGTTQGLMRLEYSATERDQRQFLAGKRYLPDDRVEQLLADDQAGVWVRTRAGVSHIELKPMTLSQKAEYFEARIRARHDRYGLVADSDLAVSGDTSSNRLSDSDNDGLWTSIYAAAECF